MLRAADYEDYIAECLRWADHACDESERQLYVAMAEAVKNAVSAKRDVINDRDAMSYTPRFLQ